MPPPPESQFPCSACPERLQLHHPVLRPCLPCADVGEINTSPCGGLAYAPNDIQQHPTTSNSTQRHPTAPNDIQQHPTTMNTFQNCSLNCNQNHLPQLMAFINSFQTCSLNCKTTYHMHYGFHKFCYHLTMQMAFIKSAAISGQGSGFRVQTPLVQGSRFRVQNSLVRGSRFTISGFRVQGSRFMFRVQS